jgi:putative transposase
MSKSNDPKWLERKADKIRYGTDAEAVSQVIGYIKGKSAIHIARTYSERKRNYVGQHFWARGYFVSTVGRDEEVIREYIRHQEHEDRRIDQMRLM